MIALQPIFDLFEEHFSVQPVTTEHALISDLQKNKVEPFDGFNLSHSKDLFRAHFLTKHALYHLQNSYAVQKCFYLDISLVSIKRLPFIEGERQTIVELDLTKEYYLNICHYFETEEEQVNELLDSFWAKYLAQDDKARALEILGLKSDTGYAQVKTRYRELAQKHHPDKGGCEERFKEIAGAKKLLDTYFRSHI